MVVYLKRTHEYTQSLPLPLPFTLIQRTKGEEEGIGEGVGYQSMPYSHASTPTHKKMQEPCLEAPPKTRMNKISVAHKTHTLPPLVSNRL